MDRTDQNAFIYVILVTCLPVAGLRAINHARAAPSPAAMDVGSGATTWHLENIMALQADSAG